MNEHDALKYWQPALLNLFGPVDNNDRKEVYHHFRKLDKALVVSIHADYCSRLRSEDFPLSDDMRELLIKLAGPHGKVILKAYQIKKGIVNGSGNETGTVLQEAGQGDS